jgi:protein-disulfide isomerase
VVGVMVATSGGGSVQPPLADTQAVTAELVGVPQADMTLGKPNAVVTIHEYSDLQCTACSAFATGILPAVIDKLVKTGAAKLAFHNWTIIDQTDSVAGAEASYAAGRQGRAWQFIELFYGNQGEERSGYVTDAFLDRVAKAAGVDVARFDSDRHTPAVTARVREDGRQALAYGFQGTPSFAVSGPRGTRGWEAACRTAFSRSRLPSRQSANAVRPVVADRATTATASRHSCPLRDVQRAFLSVVAVERGRPACPGTRPIDEASGTRIPPSKRPPPPDEIVVAGNYRRGLLLAPDYREGGGA